MYHCISRIVGGEKLLDDRAKEVLRKQIWQMAGFCGLEVLTYCVMANHLHILARVPYEKWVSDAELIRRSAILYGPADPRVGALAALFEKGGKNGSGEAEVIRGALVARMGDISIFMKELKQRFTLWFNKSHGRFGTIWAERFKSILVQDRGRGFAALTVATYIDLNPLRAGLCKDPKDYRFCGYAEALAGDSAARWGLKFLTGERAWRLAGNTYRLRLFASGSWEKGEKKASIQPKEFQMILAAGGKLTTADLMWCRVRYFSDGLVLGSEGFVRDRFEEFRGFFGRNRQTGPRQMKGADWQGLKVMRDLEKNVFG